MFHVVTWHAKSLVGIKSMKNAKTKNVSVDKIIVAIVIIVCSC